MAFALSLHNSHKVRKKKKNREGESPLAYEVNGTSPTWLSPVDVLPHPPF